MCSPATAALVLAALAALPCRGSSILLLFKKLGAAGIDADATSRILKETKNSQTEESQTITRLYQMLHSTSDPLNSSVILNNFEYTTNPTTALVVEPSISSNSKEIIKIDEIDSMNPTVRTDVGVKIMSKDIKLDKDVKRKKKRTVKIVRVDIDMTTKQDGKRIEVTTIHPSSYPLVMERRKKPGDTGSSAPLLNYIFDTYSTTHNHNHRNDRSGSGNSIYTATGPEIEAFVGSTAHLDCKVDALHDKLVSWVRRKNDQEPMDLLTTGTQLYTTDDRYSARFIPPDIWRLEVKEVRPSDAAYYDCQLSAHPPRTARVTLRVPEVSVRIVDGAGAEVSEQVCEVGSTVALRCEVRGLKMEGGPSLLWYRREDLLNDDTTRGGISVRTEFGVNGANSVLRVARVRSDDAGIYSCSVARAPPTAPPPAQVLLHVIKGESLAELHQGGTGRKKSKMSNLLIILTIYALFS